MAPGGIEPPHADSKSAALSTELRGRRNYRVDGVAAKPGFARLRSSASAWPPHPVEVEAEGQTSIGKSYRAGDRGWRTRLEPATTGTTTRGSTN